MKCALDTRVLQLGARSYMGSGLGRATENVYLASVSYRNPLKVAYTSKALMNGRMKIVIFRSTNFPFKTYVTPVHQGYLLPALRHRYKDRVIRNSQYAYNEDLSHVQEQNQLSRKKGDRKGKRKRENVFHQAEIRQGNTAEDDSERKR